MNIKNLFSRKEDWYGEEKQVKVTYGFTEYGLEKISNIDFKRLTEYGWSEYNLLSDVESDLQYLFGVADSMPNGDRVKRIVESFRMLKEVIYLPMYIEGVKAEGEDE
ncbi:hypothetical protein CL622_03565 [archaeon]|nr:hypothetical protein [archaeon]|tara:strand:- start:17 stop:337 length:321 start_codon:yes stop_codon:yes gene_type:complete